MYIYDDFDRTLVQERVREFGDQVSRRLSGELTDLDTKHFNTWHVLVKKLNDAPQLAGEFVGDK